MRSPPIAIALGATSAMLASMPGRSLAQVSETSPLSPERTNFVQTSAPTLPPASAWERLGLRGVELQVRAGLMLPDASSPVRAPTLYPYVSGDATGDILEGKESPYGPDFLGVSIALGYRIWPWLSVGAFFSYATFQPQDGTDTGDYPDTTSQLERQYWSLGAYGRYYFTRLHPRLQPWVELGAGYSDDNANYERAATQASGTGGAELSQYLLEEQGLVVPIVVGLDWRLAPVFSVGPSIGYSRIFPLRGCVTVNVDQQSPVQGTNTCSSPPVSANGYGVFFGGIYVKLTFGPATG
jgi:hypothetical protein